MPHILAQQRNTPEPARNHCNGSSKKSVLAAETKLTLDIPHDPTAAYRQALAAPAGLWRQGHFALRARQYPKSGGGIR